MKFLCDGMLGKLCRYLRMCGLDTTYSNEGTKLLVTAKKENRTVLTKNTHLKGRDMVYYLDPDNPMVQLKYVLEQFRLKDRLNLFSRCLLCNEPLASVPREEVRTKIPYYTYKNFNQFARCPKCERIYWKGSHYQKMFNEITKIIG